MGYQGGGFSGPKEMFKATCAECKKECEVPFKPREDRPVYCKDCFSKRKSSGTRQARKSISQAKSEQSGFAFFMLDTRQDLAYVGRGRHPRAQLFGYIDFHFCVETTFILT